MEDTTETKFATDDVRVLLAQDVLAQIEVGKLRGTPKGAWFIGFEYDVAKKVYADLALDLSDEGDSCLMEYDAGDEDEEEDSQDPEHGKTYLAIGARHPLSTRSIVCDTVRALDLQELLQRADSQCCVCGIGSLIVAAAARYDNMKVELLEKKGVFNALKDYFSREQLQLIEAVYEQSDYDCELMSADRAAAVDMWPDVPAGTSRLRLIMQNIIDNNGTFRLR